MTHNDDEELGDDIPLLDLNKGPRYEMLTEKKQEILEIISDSIN